MNPAHHITFLLSWKLFAEETNYSDTSCSVWSQVSSNSKSSLSLPKCLLNFYILKRAAYHTWGWCDSLAHMSSLAQDLHVIHKHQLVMSSLWQSWAPNISGLTPASGPEPCSCPAGISAEAEATWELWDGAGGWGAQLTSLEGNGTELELEQLAHDCMCLLCPVSSALITLSD